MLLYEIIFISCRDSYNNYVHKRQACIRLEMSGGNLYDRFPLDKVRGENTLLDCYCIDC